MSVGPRTNWRERGACRFEDPELFFPVGEGGLSLLQIEQARAVCRRCPVLHECRAWALRNREYDGVWGGMTAQERRAATVRGLGGRGR
ncbi:transcription factor WhiB [Streptomyces sp. F-3]|jgi:WhiB family redox-sensing transcriptional regulator|uniref:Transcriptional regulator WhiB n=1 Tax=Streptomyces thermogriseus TaxID=75292 RepID=A0ABP4DPX9_9ACTN|nr:MULTISPECIES: WhiB family transcriptional regulator [Streptomyces]MDN5383172.1 WhiB family transcriptional regulator [Streptomyces sp. LB8]GAT80665.1 transcription factor WhiB [Streptomyces sp. F-3]